MFTQDVHQDTYLVSITLAFAACAYWNFSDPYQLHNGNIYVELMQDIVFCTKYFYYGNNIINKAQ